MKNSRMTDRPDDFLKLKPPYWIAILCLIPLLGLFAGIGILLAGIFRYKDKLFMAIGIFGIVFTTGIYSYLFYQMKYGKTGRNGLTILSEMQLNTLVEKIEFYNLTNGGYPDNLEALKEIDRSAPMIDPLQVHDDKDDIKFKYTKLELGYSLFFVGCGRDSRYGR